MTLLGEQIAARYKELFFHHVENSARSKQRTLGPSEAGDPCDRRIGAALLGLPAVNPGGSGWAPFKGTAIHAALAAMFEEADAGSGRFAVEQKLTLPNVNVPRGTCDLIDRTLVTVVDHKVVGRWRLDSIRSKGPSTTYRVQAHLYGFAARLAGEAVDHIAIIAWPMESSNLDDMHVHVEPYDAGIALAALERVDRIAAAVQADGIDAYRQLPVTSGGCDWCPMHLKDVRGVRADGACNGRE